MMRICKIHKMPSLKQKCKKCKECRKICDEPNSVACTICRGVICYPCSVKIKDRAHREPWYRQYSQTCDNCIWFDIS